MASTIQAPNFASINIKAKSLLAADVAINASTISLQNVTGIANGDFFYFGNLDQGTTEKNKVNGAPSGTTITLLTNALYAHDKFENVTFVNGDQISFYRAANVDGTIPLDTAFASIATVSLVSNDLVTPYTDATGSANYWYKFTYKHSVTLAETDISQSVAVRGQDYGHYCSIDSIRLDAGLQDVSQVTDIMLTEQRTAAEAVINSVIDNNYALPLPTPVDPLIPKITTLLASGYVLSQQYSVLSPDLSRLGKDKIEQVLNREQTGLLDRIARREIVLKDSLGNSLLLPVSIQFWPDGTTQDLDEDAAGGASMFRILHKF